MTLIALIPVIGYLVGEWIFKGERFKWIRILIVSILIFLSSLFSLYIPVYNEPDEFYFSKSIDIQDKIETEKEYLDYGEFKIMRTLASPLLFRGSWLPNIIRTEKSIVNMPPEKEVESKIIDAIELKEKFKNNKFIKEIEYYRLALPPKMEIKQQFEGKGIKAKRIIEFSNSWVKLKLTLISLSPDKAIYVKSKFSEKIGCVFFRTRRESYKEWYDLFMYEMKNIERRNKHDKRISDLIREGKVDEIIKMYAQ